MIKIRNGFRERLKSLVERYDTNSEFCRSTGIDMTVIKRYLDHNIDAEPSYTILCRIIKGTKCNANWLLFGEK